MTALARRSMSSLPLLEHCAYSDRPGIEVPYKPSSTAARRGSARHKVYAKIALGRDPTVWELEDSKFDDALEHMRRVGDWFDSRHPDDDTVAVEMKLAYNVEKDCARELRSEGERDYSDARPSERCGSLDVLFRTQSGEVELWDWKTGRAHHVGPIEKNRQLLTLGLAAARLSEVDRILIGAAHVLDSGDVEPSSVTLDSWDLEEAAAWLSELEKRRVDEAPRLGWHCSKLWCPFWDSKNKDCSALSALEMTG